MQHLGNMFLIGQRVEYLNRVRIIADRDGHQVTPGPIVTGSLQAVTKEDASKPLIARTISGSNLQDAKVDSDDSNITILGFKLKSDGSGIDFTFTFDTKKFLSTFAGQVAYAL